MEDYREDMHTFIINEIIGLADKYVNKEKESDKTK